MRKGSIVIEYEGQWQEPGASWTMRFVNYFINGIAINGVRIVTNVSKGEDGTQVFTVVTKDGMMAWPNGDTPNVM
jgi:hypothetical protein